MISAQRFDPLSSDRRKTTITKISRRASTIDPDYIDHAQSAPSSPAMSNHARLRSSHTPIPIDQINAVRTKC